MFPSFLGAVEGVLNDLDVDDATINRILSDLSSGQDEIKVKNFKKTPAESFGTLDGGAEMGFHTGEAHRFMAESMADMLTTLGYFAEGVSIFRKQVKETDEVSAADLTRYTRAIQQAEGVNQRQTPNYQPFDEGGH